MTKITKINNLHIHNSNSQCAWNRYPIRIVYDEAIKANLKYVGSTNHIRGPHDPKTDRQPEDVFQRHLLWTKEEIEALSDQMEIPFYLGAEIDIIDDTGQDYILPKYRNILDYRIGGMHSLWKTESMKNIYQSEDRAVFLEEYFEEWGDWAVEFIHRSRPDIFVHIFWQELEFGLFEEKLMNATAERVFAAAAEYGTAMECSSLQMRRRYPTKPFWMLNDPRGNHLDYFNKYYEHLFQMAKSAGCSVSFGSDAHIPEDIGDVIRIKNLLEKVGFSDADIFEPHKK